MVNQRKNIIKIAEERKMGGNGWGAINNLINQAFSFLKSKNFLIILALIAIYFGVVNFEEIRDLIKTVMEFLK